MSKEIKIPRIHIKFYFKSTIQHKNWRNWEEKRKKKRDADIIIIVLFFFNEVLTTKILKMRLKRLELETVNLET